MTEKKMAQKITATRVVGNGNWEDYMWPHQIDKTVDTVEPVDDRKKSQPVTMITINKNSVDRGATQLINAFGNTSITGVQVNYK